MQLRGEQTVSELHARPVARVGLEGRSHEEVDHGSNSPWAGIHALSGLILELQEMGAQIGTFHADTSTQLHLLRHASAAGTSGKPDFTI